jgi:hypothetical protein
MMSSDGAASPFPCGSLACIRRIKENNFITFYSLLQLYKRFT